MKVALVYDRVNKWGGAERLLLTLHELFPEAHLYTSVYNSNTAPWAKVFTIKPSFLNNFPFAKSTHEAYALLMPLSFESFNFDAYDVVISVTSEAAKGIITKPSTVHICYMLTPTRYLWSGYDEYFKNSFIRFVSKPAIEYLRKWDLLASSRPDIIISISKEVQSRVKKYYRRDSEVVYPPVTLSNNKQLRIENYGLRVKNYFLVVSRLVSYKRIDIAIQACNMLQLPLVIVGTGSQESYLRSISGDKIRFVGNLTDEELASYYKNCKALLFPGFEDFGLVPAEANSFGKPVIAYRKGGAIETIIEGKTGIFFEKQSVNSLVDALKKFQLMKFQESDCMMQASAFNKQDFKIQFSELINSHQKL